MAYLVLLHRKVSPPASSAFFIAPPIPQADVPYSIYELNADSAIDILYPTGTRIHIPIGAYLNSAGQQVHGRVMLHYREFHKPSEIFLSGIPMTYDSMGKVYVFESAGMLDIAASQNNVPLTANASRPIRIDMLSDSSRANYNAYFLDTVQKRWLAISRPKVQPMDTPDTHLPPKYRYTAQEIPLDTPKQKPTPIFNEDKQKIKFHLEVDEDLFPELAGYNGIRFQPKNQEEFDPKFSAAVWGDVKIKKLNNTDYKITLRNRKDTYNIIAVPVIDEAHWAESQKIYEKKYADYISTLANKKEVLEKKQKEKYEMNLKWTKSMQDNFVRACQSNLIYSYFNVLKFGIYNSDCPRNWPKEMDVIVHSTDYSGQDLPLHDMVLIQRGMNGIYTYHFTGARCPDFKFNVSSNNSLWATTLDGKIAVIDTNAFRLQTKEVKDGHVDLRFRVLDKEIKSNQEVKYYLDS